MQNLFPSPSANILEEAEADGPMKSTQNQDHRSHTGPKYVTQIFVKIFGPEIGPHIFGKEIGDKGPLQDKHANFITTRELFTTCTIVSYAVLRLHNQTT